MKFYTGLPNFRVLKSVFDFVALPPTSTTKLTRFQEFILTLMKLRLDSPYKDLAYRFGISISTVSRIISKWLTMMDDELRDLIIWPTRDHCVFALHLGRMLLLFWIVLKSLWNVHQICLLEPVLGPPISIITLSKFCLVLPLKELCHMCLKLGVAESVINTSQSLVEFLIICFQETYDRGFDISDSVGMMQARLHIPAFTRGKSQLDALDVEKTRCIANVRIHVERVIGIVRKKYSILKGTLPLEYVAKKPDEDSPYIDKIVRV